MGVTWKDEWDLSRQAWLEDLREKNRRARAPSKTGERVSGQPGRGYVGVGALSPRPLSASPPSQAQGRSAPALNPLGSGPPQGPGHLLPRWSNPWFTRHPDTGQLRGGWRGGGIWQESVTQQRVMQCRCVTGDGFHGERAFHVGEPLTLIFLFLKVTRR